MGNTFFFLCVDIFIQGFGHQANKTIMTQNLLQLKYIYIFDLAPGNRVNMIYMSDDDNCFNVHHVLCKNEGR